MPDAQRSSFPPLSAGLVVLLKNERGIRKWRAINREKERERQGEAEKQTDAEIERKI